MGEGNGDWLRVRGIGRERFATYLADFAVVQAERMHARDVRRKLSSRQ